MAHRIDSVERRLGDGPEVTAGPAEGQPAVVIRAMAYLSLCYDPGRVSATVAARFLTTVRDRLDTGQPARGALER